MQSGQARKGTKRDLNRTAKCLQRQIAASVFANPRDAFESNVRKYATSKILLQIQATRDECRRGRSSLFLISFVEPAKPSTTGIVWNPRGCSMSFWQKTMSDLPQVGGRVFLNCQQLFRKRPELPCNLRCDEKQSLGLMVASQIGGRAHVAKKQMPSIRRVSYVIW